MSAAEEAAGAGPEVVANAVSVARKAVAAAWKAAAQVVEEEGAAATRQLLVETRPALATERVQVARKSKLAWGLHTLASWGEARQTKLLVATMVQARQTSQCCPTARVQQGR